MSDLSNVGIMFYRGYLFMSISSASLSVPEVQGPCFSTFLWCKWLSKWPEESDY